MEHLNQNANEQITESKRDIRFPCISSLANAAQIIKCG
jgi:hypothetical protein